MKKGKKVYELIHWSNDTHAEYTVFHSKKEIYSEKPYNKTLNKAKKVYGFYWCGGNWPHCEIWTYSNIGDYINGKDPISVKTYYK